MVKSPRMDTWLLRPPILVGERIVWLGSGSGLPQCGIVRWIGKLPEMGSDWTVGVELDNPLPYGGIDGTWGSRQLFTCEPKHGLLVPVTKTIKECDLYQWSKENIETNLQYGRREGEVFREVPPGSPTDVPEPRIPPTCTSPVSKLVTSEGPRPAVRRRKRQCQVLAHDTHLPTQQPKAPKRKVKSEVISPLPRIYESNKENSKSPLTYFSDINTIKSSSSDFHTLKSFSNDIITPEPSHDFDTLTSSYNCVSLPKSSLNNFNTLETYTSGDYSDYQWFDAKDEGSYFTGCENSLSEPVNVNIHKQYHVIEGQQIRIIQGESCKRIEVKTPSHGGGHIERMNEFNVQTKSDKQDNDSSYEDTTTAVERLHSNQFGQHLSDKSAFAANTDSGSRQEKTASGFFSFLRWFRKGKDGDDNCEEVGDGSFIKGLADPEIPSLPQLIRSTSSSCGSIDTLFSTATVNSFAFVTPASYRPFGSASQPEKRIAVGPDTDTYKDRLQQRDQIRELDRNLTLRKKYHLFGSGTLVRSSVNTPNSSPVVERKDKDTTEQAIQVHNLTPGSQNSTYGKKKRKAPDPPRAEFSDSLPNSLDKCRSKSKSMDNGDPIAVRKPRHRRTVSDSAKDKKAGAYCHVKGKCRAPQPPSPCSNSELQDDSTLERLHSQFGSFGRKKRPAPQPPEDNINKRDNKDSWTTHSYQERSKSTVEQLSPEEKERLIANIAKLKAHADKKALRSLGNMDSDSKSSEEQVVCNDSLKLERGVLKPNKELPKMDTSISESKAAPVSPRPWYKRNLTNKDGLSGLKRDIFKSLEKKKEREKEKHEEWMPEVGIPRVVGSGLSSDGSSCSSTSSKFNIFARLDRSDDKKKESDKRKSQVSLLANISELDREAAEIVQKEQAREQALLAAQDAKFYSYPDVPVMSSFSEEVEIPKRSSARELISLFNAIGNATKVTVNTTFFSKEGSGFFSREGIEKRFSFMGESLRTAERRVAVGEKTFQHQKSNQAFVTDSNSSSANSPGVERDKDSIDSTGMTGTSDLGYGVSIEEIEDGLEKSSRSQVMYEVNKSRRHNSPSPSIPTIAEQSESASSVATTPASTLDPQPDSNRDCSNIPVTDPSPDVLQHAKRVTIWSCPRCTLENPRWKISCDACGRWRPSVMDDETDSLKCDEPFQRPTSPLHDTKKPTTNKVQIIKMELSKKGKGINWEEELKRYLPQKDISKDKNISKHPSEDTDLRIENIAKISVDGIQINSNTHSQVVAVAENDTGKTKSEELLTDKNKASPSTFIGDVKEDKEKVINKSAEGGSGTVMVNGVVPLREKPDVDEVRKARLAFFNRTAELHNQSIFCCETSVLAEAGVEQKVHEDISSELATRKKQVDKNEQLKLREMLKDMKNSLPKRPQKTIISIDKNQTSGVGNSLKSNEGDNIESKRLHNVHKLGAIKKVPQKVSKREPKDTNNPLGTNSNQEDKFKFQNGIEDENKKAEAICITTKTVYEDIKVKKAGKPLKVSTSVQTNSYMRKTVVEQGENSKSVTMVPVTVEEFSTTGIKDGVLYTSLNKDSRRIGKGTFELIHARDFANIEATKITGESSAVHVYANVPPSSIPEQNSHLVSECITQPVFPPQQPVPALVQHHSGNKRNVSKTEESTQNGKKNDHGNQGVAFFKESSHATSSVTSADSDLNKGGPYQLNRRTSETSNSSVASVSSGDCSEVERLTAQLTLPKGIADFKADLRATPPEQNMNTLAINRLLRRLEAAIAGGQHNQAAVLAKDLARLKISCSVTRQRRSLDASPASIMVDMYVEDKVSHQGPISLQVIPTMTVAQLKKKVEEEFEIPVRVQRWILGKLLASDDTKMLQDHNLNSNGCPMFLYLVAPDGEQEGDSMGTAESIKKHSACEVTAHVPVPAAPQPEHPGGGWYYNNEEDRYSFCEDSESEMTDNDDDDSRETSPVKEGNRPDESRKDTKDDDNEKGDDAVVGAAAVVIHERPVVVQAPFIGRSFVKQAPHFQKTVVDQQPNRSSSSRASQLLSLEETMKPGTDQTFQSTKGTPVRRVTIAGPKAGTLQLGWKCPLCTLVNSPTRPGCAACTTERPLRYVVPVEYRANEQELQRMKQEQLLDNELQQITTEQRLQELEKQHQHYLQLVDLDNTDLVPNMEPFECSVCIVQYEAGEGVVLRECLHVFCRACLASTVQFNEEAEVKCPYRDADYACNSVLQEREIKALVPADVYEQHLAKSVAQAENKIGNAFHCKTPDCRGWCIFEDNVNEFRCPVCRRTNCLTCQAVHDGMNCKQYQEQVKQESETNAEARRTKEMLEEMVERGEAMNCPTCQVILMKKWGCDWLRCSMCKTEICWVTRGPRWGPGGKGDTTGGCQCGVNGVKCHPRCNYCH